MYLKRLELHGFKSFALNAALEFQRGVSAVVGPNGSGKSNVADAIRFVLGEQSLRSIRSKKGEDLIFSGSPARPRMNMAGVSIHFDNQDKAFPLDYETVTVRRKIFRDGENQYFINNSQVRLKDVTELIAKAKLGLKGYTVINQGMGDAVLSASSKERKEIIFEALGLREFQMKKAEALSRLAQTKANMEKAESVTAELAPHLRSLKKQVERMEERDDLRQKLVKMENQLWRKKMSAVERALSRIEKEAAAENELIGETKRYLELINSELDEENKKIFNSFGDLPKLENSLLKIEEERNGIEREVGKIEGIISFVRRQESEHPSAHRAIDLSYVHDRFEDLGGLLDKVLEEGNYQGLRRKLEDFRVKFLGVLGSLREGRIPSSGEAVLPPPASDLSQEEKRRQSLLDLLADSDKKLKSVKEEIKRINDAQGEKRERIFEMKNKRRELELRLSSAEERYASLSGEREKYVKEKYLLEKEKELLSGAMDLVVDDDAPFLPDDDGMIREIERVKIKLENIDLIDQNVKEEYEAARKRHDFLEKELNDLQTAVASLGTVAAELDETISARFKAAFKTINDNFNEYFTLLFEGGRARLEVSKVSDNEEDPSGEEKEKERADYGIDLEVSLPRKKTTSLAVLSGGERALTSLALLFALVSTSPPPFLVLDEIDAPLDEANSLRFGKIISELKKHTQFVIITHNRETMRQADTLYGVTMEEDGVSKLLSLKFNEPEEILTK